MYDLVFGFIICGILVDDGDDVIDFEIRRVFVDVVDVIL